MSLLLLEALGALLVLLLIVWWTMFSGRKQGELPPTQTSHTEVPSKASSGHGAKQLDQFDR